MMHKQASCEFITSKTKEKPGLGSLKPIEVATAERLNRQVEEYIKKRIEHLEVMRDQVEKVQKMRLER